MARSTLQLDSSLKQKLTDLAKALINQEEARVLVPPLANASGYWFGGGNLVQLPSGDFLLAGRYRNHGDSRTGLAAGERGLELALFRSTSFSGAFEKILSFPKPALNVGSKEVLSIEGSSLYLTNNGVELYVSSEKKVAYPEGYESFQKPGTGVWSIDRLTGDSVDTLSADSIQEILACDHLPTLHIKDPVVFDHPASGTAMVCCTHPFSWSSTNTSLALRGSEADEFTVVTDNVLPRGLVWDVAVTRITDRMPVPQVGAFQELPPISLYFYDGAECIRSHEQSDKGVERPRGYSCEEISGVAWGSDEDFPNMDRLSVNQPFFVSPHGTGCSRYASTLVTSDAIYATWEQSQPDLSQPLVGHALPMDEVERLLSH